MKQRMRSLYLLVKSTKNWVQVLKFRFLGGEKLNVKFRNGHIFQLTKQNWENYIIHSHLFAIIPSAKLGTKSLEFKYRNKQLRFEFGNFGFDTIFEVFAFDPYKDFMKKLSPQNKQVVDIGAAFGDTAIYFLFHGAKHVIGYEANPAYHELAKRNIAGNQLEKEVSIELCAVGAEVGSLMIDSDSVNMFGANMDKPKGGTKVPMTTLSEIVRKNDIHDGFLKLDTEGFEYEILLNTPKEVIRKFSSLLIEYHYGFEKLEAYLTECGYEFFHTGPSSVYVPFLKDEKSRQMSTGHIVAWLK